VVEAVAVAGEVAAGKFVAAVGQLTLVEAMC
jgi:hypothetical protein